MKKRVYKRVDVSQLTPKQLRVYKKRLASVRAYTQIKRQWEKDIRNGKIPKSVTLEQYKGSPSDTVTDMKSRTRFFKSQNIDVAKMERLVTELQKAIEKEKEREEDRKRLATLLEEFEELRVA